MPFLSILTNVTVPEEHQEKLIASASRVACTILEKPEEYMMLALQTGVPIHFAESYRPAAFLDLRSIGLPEGKSEKLAATLTAIVGSELAIPSDRIYLNFTDVPRNQWGWKGATF
jgi:phenylpyruvate tautomerase PptA (4-oxalocrotonate tautomerase family)